MVNWENILSYKSFLMMIVAVRIWTQCLLQKLLMLIYFHIVQFFKSISVNHSNCIPGHFRTNSGTDYASNTLVKPICTGGIGISYFSFGTDSMQSTGQKGTQAWQPVQLSSSTTATDFGRFFFTFGDSGNSGIPFKWLYEAMYWFQISPKINKSSLFIIT